MSFAAYCAKGHFIGAVHQQGHTFTAAAHFASLSMQERRWPPYCPACGSSVFERCPECDERFGLGANFCVHCATVFPWTEAALSAAREAVDEAEELSPEERTTLKDTLPDLAVESPRTPLAASRFEKLTAKAGPIFGTMFKEIVVPVLGAEVKKKLGLQ